jgi:nucleoside-diphosphate-sugar epimerase
MMPSKHLLITGGSGFIGRQLAGRLRREGHAVTLFDLYPPAWDFGEARFVRGDIRDPASVRRVLRGIDVVFHLAAAHHDSGIAEATYFSVNEGGTRVLCEGMAAAGIRDHCFFSSVAAVGAASPPPMEQSIPRPAGPYGKSKLAGELVVREWVLGDAGRRALIIRPVAVFGPNSFANMYALIRQIARGRYLQVGRGDNVKSLVYIDNVIEATMALWESPWAPGVRLIHLVDRPDLKSVETAAALHRAMGKPLPRLRIPLGLAVAAAWPLELIARTTGWDLPITSTRIRKFAAAASWFSSTELDTSLCPGYVPLLEGLARAVEWYRTEGSGMRPVANRPPAAVLRWEEPA